MLKLTDYDKAIRAASKRLPFKSAKQMNELLEYAADDLAEAYRIGAEEAQGQIVLRLKNLAALKKMVSGEGAEGGE